jgi:hypothetical protein
MPLYSQQVTPAEVAPYKSGYYNQAPVGNGTAIPAEAEMHLTPLVIPRTLSIDRIGAYCSVIGTAGALFRCGIYSSNSDGFPTALLGDYGTVVATSTGQREITISQALSAGVYWLASVVQGGAGTRPTVAITPNSRPTPLVLHGTSFNQFAQAGYYQASVTAGLPDPFVPTGTTGSAICTWVRYV